MINEMTEYVRQTAQLLNLQITLEYLPGVVENLTTMAAIASVVTEFTLPEEIQSAPVFEP